MLAGLPAAALMFFAFAGAAVSQTVFNGRSIGTISIVFPTGGPSTADEEEFRSIAANAAGPSYSVVRVRDSIEALHRTGRIASVEVEAQETSSGVDLRYLIKRKVQAQKYRSRS